MSSPAITSLCFCISDETGRKKFQHRVKGLARFGNRLLITYSIPGLFLSRTQEFQENERSLLLEWLQIRWAAAAQAKSRSLPLPNQALLDLRRVGRAGAGGGAHLAQQGVRPAAKWIDKVATGQSSDSIGICLGVHNNTSWSTRGMAGVWVKHLGNNSSS